MPPTKKSSNTKRPLVELAPADTLLSASFGAGALSLDVVGFADERAADLQSVSALLVKKDEPAWVPRASAIVRPLREQERLLRRRGGSNVVWRWRTHKPVLPSLRAQLLGKSRRDRRRAAVLRARTAMLGGLETEAWHAKRFEMVRFGGLRLPWRARDRAEGSAVRACNQGCTLHDASYWRCLTLRAAEFQPIFEMLGRLTGLPSAALARQLSSGREVVCMLHRLDAHPAAAVAPIKLLSCRPPSASAADAHAAAERAGDTGAAHMPSGCAAWAQGLSAPSMVTGAASAGGGAGGDGNGGCGADTAAAAATAAAVSHCCVRLFVHNAAASQAHQGLTEDAVSSGGAVEVRSGPPLLRFQLRGPTSHAVLSRALHACVSAGGGSSAAASGGSGSTAATTAAGISGHADHASVAAWRALGSLDSPVVLPPRVALGIEIINPSDAPHPQPPPRRGDKHRTLGSNGSGGGGGGGSVGGGGEGSQNEDASTAQGRAAQARALRRLVTAWPPALAASRLHAGADEGGGGGSGGSGGSGGGSDRGGNSRKGGGDTVSILLVQQPAASHDPSSRLCGGFGSGWDLLLPAGSSAGRGVWHALVLAGGRAIGQKELRAISLHADQPLFPYDYPDTLAGLRAELAEAEQRRGRHSRKPPLRRPNHEAMRVQHPFGQDWPALLRVPRTLLPQAAAAAAAAAAAMETEADMVTPANTAVEEAAAAAAAAPPPLAPPPPPPAPVAPAPVMQFGVLRGAHAAAIVVVDTPLSPLLRAVMPRMLVRVCLEFPGKGCPRAPAAIHTVLPEQLRAWRHNRSWGGSEVPPGTSKPIPSGALVGFVSNGGFSKLQGRSAAVGFCAAEAFAELLRTSAEKPEGAARGGGKGGGGGSKRSVLVLVRNTSSRQFRPALASLRV